MRRLGALLTALAFVAGGCGDDDQRTATGASTSAVPREPTPASTTSSAVASSPADVAPGRAVVEAGDARWEFTVDTCLVGHDQTGSPYSRLTLSGTLVADDAAEDGDLLTASILVSEVAPGHEEHVISVYRADRPSLGAADLQVPSRGGPAPDDWLEVGDGVVTGSGFELWEIEPGGERFPPGTLVADCPAADG